MKKKKQKLFIVFVAILSVFLLYWGYERWPSEKWKEYRSLVRIWPRLKKEGIESIRFCEAISLEYGYDLESDFQKFVGMFSFHVRGADVVKWWPSDYKVPKEKLPECIKIIDKAIENAERPWWLGGRYWPVWPLSKMLVVTDKGNYIVHIGTDISEVAGPKVYGEEWVSHELGEFILKYCIPSCERRYFLPSKEQTVAILIFSDRNCEDYGAHDSMIVWPPVVLLGDKKKAEKLMGRQFEPRMVFEGREWLEKIMAAYEVAMKDAKEKEYSIEDISVLQGWIVVVTQDEFYWRGIGIGENAVVGEDIIESKRLKEYFDELGLTEELLAGEPKEADSD